MLEPHHPPGEHCTPDCKDYPEQCPTNAEGTDLIKASAGCQ